MLEPATFIGLGLVALWLHVRYPRLRPGSITRALAHVAVSFGAFALLPSALDILPQLFLALALLIVSLTYVLLSWVWLLARILQDLSGGNPRGGHPATSEH
jgi:hypothetical protein